MKKKILVGLILLTVSLCLTGCLKKNSISGEKFKVMLDSDNYDVINIKDQITDNVQIKEAYYAVNRDENYKIYYYCYTSEEKAKEKYDSLKKEINDNNKITTTKKEKNIGNYSKLQITTSSKYIVVSRIKETIVYSDENVNLKDDIDLELKTIGY